MLLKHIIFVRIVMKELQQFPVKIVKNYYVQNAIFKFIIKLKEFLIKDNHAQYLDKKM